MSVVATLWAWQQDLPPTEKLVLLRLADAANQETGFECYPSHHTVATDCGVSKDTVKRAISVLVENGLVTVAARFGENGRQTSNVYRLWITREPTEGEGGMGALGEGGMGAPPILEPKERTKSSSRADEYVDAAAASETVHNLTALLDRLEVDRALRAAAHQDPERAIACAEKTLAANPQNPGGYFRRLLQSGDTPVETPPARSSPKTNVLPKDPFKALLTAIRNGAMTDPYYLEAEIRDHGFDEQQVAALRAAL